MGAVICSCQVVQAGPGQPGQASRRAGPFHQAGDALAVGHFGGPQQHPVHGQDPQSAPGGTEAGIEQNAVADDNMVRHSTSPRIRRWPGLRPQVLSGHAEGQEDSGRNTPRYPAARGMLLKSAEAYH